MSSFTIDSCIRGYHVYKEVWNATFGEILICQTEFGNFHDPYAVAVLTSNDTIVGHVPRNISAVCHFFLRKNGNIICQVTGRRRYSLDLAQGGLEVPCSLTFSGAECHLMNKVQKLIEKAPAISASEPPSKKVKIEKVSNIDDDDGNDIELIWLSLHGCCSLTLSDKNVLSQDKMLNDRHINFAQKLLLNQFPNTEGLQCTLLQNKMPRKKIEAGVQIIHDRGNHWIVASTINSASNVVKVYDSIYTNVDVRTKKIIVNLFKLSDEPKFDVVKMQKQVGSKDCGLFSIAVVTALLFDGNMTFCQQKMRQHLLSCFEAKLLSLFPIT